MGPQIVAMGLVFLGTTFVVGDIVCPPPAAGQEICAAHGTGIEQTFPSRCHLDQLNAVVPDGNFIFLHDGQCQSETGMTQKKRRVARNDFQSCVYLNQGCSWTKDVCVANQGSQWNVLECIANYLVCFNPSVYQICPLTQIAPTTTPVTFKAATTTVARTTVARTTSAKTIATTTKAATTKAAKTTAAKTTATTTKAAKTTAAKTTATTTKAATTKAATTTGPPA